METAMSAKFPMLPIAGGTLVGVFASLLALVTRWLKELAEARRHRREANALIGLDQRMLADIGITRADVRDAFSEPFWDDPTARSCANARSSAVSATRCAGRSFLSAAECLCSIKSGGRPRNELKQTADPLSSAA